MATFTNQATLTYAGNTTNSNVVTGEFQQTVDVTKTSLDDNYSTSDTLTYIVNIANTGTTPLTALTLSDNLGAYTFGTATPVPLDYVTGSIAYYVNGVQQTDPTVTDTDPLTVTGISVPAGGNAQIIYQATTNGFASPVAGGSITNTVTVTGAGLAAPVTDDLTIPAAAEAFLTVEKALSPALVADGDRLTYTFTIRNFGNTPVTTAGDAVITDTFDPILTDLVVTFNGATWAEGTDYTYNDATGLFTTLPNRLTVPAATYTQDPTTGAWTVVPGVSTLTVVGTV